MPFTPENAAEYGQKGGRTVRLRHDPGQFVDQPVAFMRELVDPASGEPFEVYSAQAAFLEEALTLTPDGRLPYPELVFSAPKKSGKTHLAAVILLYVVRVLGGRYAEGYALANDLEQSRGRVFSAVKRIIRMSPILQGLGSLSRDLVTFKGTEATIQALASDYAGAAGSNANIATFDELWAYTTERSHRLWDEMVPPPTRKVGTRLTTTYAGFSGESDLLEGLYNHGIAGELIGPNLYRSEGQLTFWSHEPVAPWQTDKWLARMRRQLRTNQYLRMIENRFVTSEEAFVSLEQWDACTDPELRPVELDRDLSIFIGVDASVKRDRTALVAVTWDAESKRVRLVNHREFQPTPEDPIDFEATVEQTLLDWRRRYRVRVVKYDPYQLVSSAQRLTKAGLPMVEFPQSLSNLTQASQQLHDLIKGGNLWAYPDEAIRTAVSRAVAIEGPRGWRIAKAKATHSVDVVVALAQAALACVQGTSRPPPRLVPIGGVARASQWEDGRYGTSELDYI